MQAKKVAGRQGPGWSGEMDPETRAAAAAVAANALFIFSAFTTGRQELPRPNRTVRAFAASHKAVLRLFERADHAFDPASAQVLSRSAALSKRGNDIR
jgi:hypothetical protein